MSSPNSLLSRKFDIPSIVDDVAKWDLAWEETLGRLTTPEDIFLILKDTWKLDERGSSSSAMVLSDAANRIRGQVLRSQELAAKLLGELYDRDFGTVCAMMQEEELKRHYFNGMKEACGQASLREDGRALCPEITVNIMLERMNFRWFVDGFQSAVELAGAGNLVVLHSGWWDSAVKNIPEPVPEDIKFAFAQLTLQRNEFIAGFILHTLVSIVRELNFLSPIANLLKSEDFFSSSAWDKTSTTALTQVFCTYCMGSAEELGKRLKFLSCSNCLSTAKVDVRYCSRPCQLADRKTHKLHCGKVKPSSPNTGDRTWYHCTRESQRPQAQDEVSKRFNVTASRKCSNPERPLSPALQRQIALLKQHPDVDYFFFDDRDAPVPFVMSSPDGVQRMNFSDFQEECMFGAQLTGLDVVAEYTIKAMIGREPGLGVARMIKQLSEEYGVDVKRLMKGLRRKKIDKGYDPRKTFLEEMSKAMVKDLLRPGMGADSD